MRNFVRIALSSPQLFLSSAYKNAKEHTNILLQAEKQSTEILLFPELSLTGYTNRDLFHQQTFLKAGLQALEELKNQSQDKEIILIVGLALKWHSALYNCAVVIQNGLILGVVPKSYLPNGNEFEGRRWFTSGLELSDQYLQLFGQNVPFGTDLLFSSTDHRNFTFSIEICEDMWVPSPPSMQQCLAGSEIIFNLSASNATVGKYQKRRFIAKSHALRGKCAYVYTSSGTGESSTDLLFDGDSFVTELSEIIAENERYSLKSTCIYTDIDLENIRYQRLRSPSFFGNAQRHQHIKKFRSIYFQSSEAPNLLRSFTKTPFLPSAQTQSSLINQLQEIYQIQSHALYRRMKAIGTPKLILGLSGGLDSTQAVLVCSYALKLAGRPPSDLFCFTMPGFGSSNHTQNNAQILAHALGATFEALNISSLSHQLLKEIGHPATEEKQSLEQLLTFLREKTELADITFQNVQARIRTLLLMSFANKYHGLVIGTGDLSEKALGWSTYAGDHISMYDLNSSVPKTLIIHLILHVANNLKKYFPHHDSSTQNTISKVLEAIISTPISPELLPTQKNGDLSQYTEEELGPFILHDFFLYHLVRNGSSVTRCLDLAHDVFANQYTLSDCQFWLRRFLKRFFSQQFKRSCTADGPKVGIVSLSPRGDWRMPSDALVDNWLQELDHYTA